MDAIMESEPERKISKRGKVAEGRPTKRSPEVVATTATAIATGHTFSEGSVNNS
jgi:hypothetical protein